MTVAKPGPAWRADALAALTAAVQRDGDRVLAELARQARRDALAATGPPFTYTPSHRAQQAIPAAMFHRPYALALAAVELTLHGYCVMRTPAPGQPAEAVFSLGRPPWWRRLLRPAPLLALHVRAHGGAVTVRVGAAGARAIQGDPPPCTILLAPELQAALLRLHATPSMAIAAPRWLRRARNRHGPSATQP
jgi:hypothetical protein